MSRGPWGPNHPFFQAWGTALHGPEAPTGGGQLLGAQQTEKQQKQQTQHTNGDVEHFHSFRPAGHYGVPGCVRIALEGLWGYWLTYRKLSEKLSEPSEMGLGWSVGVPSKV